jgi:hypothetical protein
MGTYSSYPEKLTPYPAFPTTLACKFNDKNKYKKYDKNRPQEVTNC